MRPNNLDNETRRPNYVYPYRTKQSTTGHLVSQVFQQVIEIVDASEIEIKYGENWTWWA